MKKYFLLFLATLIISSTVIISMQQVINDQYTPYLTIIPEDIRKEVILYALAAKNLTLALQTRAHIRQLNIYYCNFIDNNPQLKA